MKKRMLLLFLLLFSTLVYGMDFAVSNFCVRDGNVSFDIRVHGMDCSKTLLTNIYDPYYELVNNTLHIYACCLPIPEDIIAESPCIEDYIVIDNDVELSILIPILGRSSMPFYSDNRKDFDISSIKEVDIDIGYIEKIDTIYYRPIQEDDMTLKKTADQLFFNRYTEVLAEIWQRYFFVNEKQRLFQTRLILCEEVHTFCCP
ncbi:MAG TPA: hypothetical protein DDW78_06180 [Treponema sp.]|nr:hypothetical protein [Treponema sp.]